MRAWQNGGMCPHCERTEGQIKIGHNSSGSQGYMCKVRRRKYAPIPREVGYAEKTRQAALRLYIDGMNQRRIARTVG